MNRQVRNNRERDPSPPALLISAHCSTIRRQSKRLEAQELSAILDDFVRELTANSLRLRTYLHSLNEIIKSLNSNFPPALFKLTSHYFFTLVRDRIRNLLEQLCTYNRLNDQELYTLRNCTVLIHDFIKEIEDVSKVLHWITNATFLDALANCLNHTNKISQRQENKNVIKQIARLLSIFCKIQERLPIDLHQHLFTPLLQPTINCLTATNYVKLFQHLKPDAVRFTEIQKLFLVRCPHFLTSYNGIYADNLIEQVFEKMLPRYVSILDRHMKTIKQWNRPMMRAVHNLIITIIYGEDYFSSRINSEAFRSLIDHLLRLLNEPALVNKISPDSNNVETLLIDATVIVFSILVYELDALEYMKQRKSAEIFRQLTTTPCETIVVNAYMLLAYTISDNDIKASQYDLSKLLSTTVNLLRKVIKKRHGINTNPNINQENLDRNILQLVETLKGLSQYEQIKNEIFKKGIVSLLISFYEKLHGLSKQVLLECLWTLSFNEDIAQQIRQYPQFILSLQNIPKSNDDNIQQNTMRRSHSYSNLRKNNIVLSNQATNNGIKNMADGLLWKIVQEPEFRKKILEKIQKQTETDVASDNRKYKYDIMISYSDADKDIVYRIQQLLTDQGYNIWFDRNHNQRQAMDIVADAIENSEFVIICMSDSYKRDNHCQAEAEYAFNSKRSLIPVIIRNSYKPDGWLSFVINNGTYIDFGSSHFKTVSKLLIKEIKQQQQKNRTVDLNPRILTPAGSIVPNPSGSLTASNKLYAPVDFSKSNEATSSSSASFPPTTVNEQQQQPSTLPISRTPTAVSTSTTASTVINKEQHSEASVHHIPRSSTPGSSTSIASGAIAKEKQQASTLAAGISTMPLYVNKEQQQIPARPISRTLPASFMSSDPSVIVQQQQQRPPIHILSAPSASDIKTSTTSTIIDKQQQQQTTLQSTSRSPMPVFVPSSVSFVVNKQQTTESIHSLQQSSVLATGSSTTTTELIKQQQEVVARPPSRASTSSTISSDASVNIEKKQLQLPVQVISRSPMANAASSVASSTVIHPHHQQQQPMQSVVQSITNSTVPSPKYVAVEQQRQETQVLPLSRPTTTGNVPSVASTVLDQPQLHQTTKYSASQPLISNTAPSVTSKALDKEQQQIPIHSPPQGLTNGNTPSAVFIDNDKYRQETQVRSFPGSSTSGSVPSTASAVADKQQRQTPIHPVTQPLTNKTPPSPSSFVVNKQSPETPIHPILRPPTISDISSATSIASDIQQRTPPQSISKLTVPTPVRSVISGADNKQQEQTSGQSTAQSSTSGSGSSGIPNDIKQQQELQQNISAHSNSRSTTPAASSINSALTSSTPTNVPKQLSLLKEYMNRKSDNSKYRNLSINAWSNNDVLDFLSDLNLYPMMPLCESMSGKALTRLFRMCQAKPSRLYGQLNEELRIRFKGLTLPMGVYTQFLIEMDGLVGPTPESLLPVSPSRSKRLENILLTPLNFQQLSEEIRSSSRPSIRSINSPGGSKSATPVQIMSRTTTPLQITSRTTTPLQTRVVERAIFRPASSIGRPYNFIVESVEESTEVLQQVERYGPQLLSLDDSARQYRQINSSIKT